MVKGKIMEDLENRFTELALAGDFDDLKTLVEKNPTVNIDCTDSTGMTALQQAAFRGNADMCRYLLDKGADVNSDKHENQYTALMFAALSGNEDVVYLMLEAGAKSELRNSVNRTAAELAAFVSQYHIVGVINNFIPSKDLIQYTKAKGQEKPKLKPQLLKPFHQLINDSNINPIHLLQKLKSNPELLDDSKSLQKVLSHLFSDNMDPHNTHEPVALKLHYLSCILEKAADAKSKDGNLDGYLKSLARGRESDGFLEQVEKVMRSTLRNFPKTDSNLFKMLVKQLSEVELGEYPTAMTAFGNVINGKQMRADDNEECDLCNARNPKKCKACSQAYYCSAVCQKLHWPTHKKPCKIAKEQKEKEEEEDSS